MLTSETMSDSGEKAIFTQQLYEKNARFLWGLSYRMTGSAADSEDIVQEAFIRAMEKPPADPERDWRPWLIRITINLCRDHLRKRRRTGYIGAWLPSPVPTDNPESPIYEQPSQDSPSAHYDLQESVTFAFLLSLEALNPAQRAVLLLRDVFDYSTKEVATLLQITETTVKVTLHRARRIIRSYTAKPVRAKSETAQVLHRFVECLKNRDAAGLERLLREDVIVCSDGGGEVAALHAILEGRAKALQLVTRLNDLYRGSSEISFCELNSAPSLLIERTIERHGHASRFTMHCEIDPDGRISRLNFVLAPKKLSALNLQTPAQHFKF